MASEIEEDLMQMLQVLTINAGVQYEIDSLDILLEHQFYFEICQEIFPELNMKLLRISENVNLDENQKMQKLLHLLGRQLQIDLSSISGQEILKGHLIHMHKLLRILEKFSECNYYEQKQNGGQQTSNRPKSDPNTSQRIEDVHKPRSARNKVLIGDVSEEYNERQSTGSEENSSIKQKPAKKQYQYSAQKKRQRSQKQCRKNVYSSVMNIIINQKQKAITASLRDNRKKKNEEITEAKNKYKSYLENYKKQTRATKNRNKLRKKPKPVERELPLSDFEHINNFFESFNYKFRDQKYCYLKRINKMIRDQQLDRMVYNNRLHRDIQRDNEKKTQKLLQRVNNQYRIRKDLLQQKQMSDKEVNKVQQKQYERYIRQQKKELKKQKKQELNKITEFIDQENRKVLINLEEGGRLEKLILSMYKRF